MTTRSKLFEYGLEAAQVGRLLYDPELRTLPQRTLTDAAHYWPPEALPFARALACVDIVLLRSEEAGAIYCEAVKALELPGCQALISQAKEHASDTIVWTNSLIGARARGKAAPKPPTAWGDAYGQYKDDADCLFYIGRIRNFILRGFNRQIDQDNEAWKVLPDNAPYLVAVVCCRTVAEHCKAKLENWNRSRPGDIDRIMREKPAKRDRGRDAYRMLTKLYKHYTWALRHDAKLLKGADKWYKSRVDPGTIEAYRDELAKEAQKIDTSNFTTKELKDFEAAYYTDQGNLSAAIEPYNEVTGYLCKRRN